MNSILFLLSVFVNIKCVLDLLTIQYFASIQMMILQPAVINYSVQMKSAPLLHLPSTPFVFIIIHGNLRCTDTKFLQDTNSRICTVISTDNENVYFLSF